MSTNDPPGSHPHADRPNWRPAETLEDYLRNVREGLEQTSDRRLAKLMDVPRTKLWRMRLLAELPEDLFERLLAAGVHSRQLASVAQAMRTGEVALEADGKCPHCGGLLYRKRISGKAVKLVNDWLDEGELIRKQWCEAQEE